MTTSEPTYDKHTELVPPPGFKFDPESMTDYDQQVRSAISMAAYDAEPLPSFEGVPTVDITPTFNPTQATESEVYARDRVPRDLEWKTWADQFGETEPPVLWRVVDRAKLQDGTALVSSRILLDNGLGDVEGFNPNLHLLSYDTKRMSDPALATPYISFSTDPQDLAKIVILKYGFGVKWGQDAVVVKVQADPHRVVTENRKKSTEVLLVGGVAPTEYVAAYEINDFLGKFVDDDETVGVKGREMTRDQALGHWAVTARS